MNCIICNSESKYSFSKVFENFDLGTVDYWTCISCGFTISATHQSMSAERWERLNRECHTIYQGTDTNPADPRWLQRLGAQSTAIHEAYREGLIPDRRPWLDFACGDGKLSDLLLDQSGLSLRKYEKFMEHEADYLKTAELVAGGFDFVVTTSVFEHLTKRREFDAIAALVSDTGVMGVHTLVRENIPEDPTWFYLQPPHCAFHTNRSMEHLFRQWGYASSVYHVESRLWLWFKTDMRDKIDQSKYVYKDGFVDYWK